MGSRATSHPSAARVLAGRVKRRLQALALRGQGAECPCCGRSFRRFVGFEGRPEAMCPGCGSLERQRTLLVFLRARWLGEERPARLLHFAPEAALAPHLAEIAAEYVTADLNKPADLKLDICDLDLPDESFDAIICSHVLEHVPDDRRAMREMLRVLRPGGEAIVLVPIDWSLDETDEDLTVTDPAERLRRYGQFDHVRMYAPDIADRLREEGFGVETFGDEERSERARIHLCVKPG